MSAEAPYQNGVTVRAHSRSEPLVGLEINLNFGVIHKGGAIPWRKTKQQKTPVSRHEKKRALAHADPSTHILHPPSQARGNIWTIGKKALQDSSYTIFHPV